MDHSLDPATSVLTGRNKLEDNSAFLFSAPYRRAVHITLSSEGHARQGMYSVVRAPLEAVEHLLAPRALSGCRLQPEYRAAPSKPSEHTVCGATAGIRCSIQRSRLVEDQAPVWIRSILAVLEAVQYFLFPLASLGLRWTQLEDRPAVLIEGCVAASVAPAKLGGTVKIARRIEDKI